MKRRDPKKRGLTEQRYDSQKIYGRYLYHAKKQAPNINPIFLQDHYGVKKGAVKDE